MSMLGPTLVLALREIRRHVLLMTIPAQFLRLIDDWTPATGSEDRSGVQITHAHQSSGAQSHSDPRHPLVSVEPVSAGRCGVLVVDHDRDEAIQGRPRAH